MRNRTEEGACKGSGPTLQSQTWTSARRPRWCRLIAGGGITAVVVTGLTRSRGERPDLAVVPRGAVVTQLKSTDLPQEAEVHSRPVQSDRTPVPVVAAIPQMEEPDRKPTRIGFGYYFERQRVQGDGTEGECIAVRRACSPPGMPEVCHLPPTHRASRPVWRE
jgi:hypothetical protein